jgi:hypothetical protein
MSFSSIDLFTGQKIAKTTPCKVGWTPARSALAAAAGQPLMVGRETYIKAKPYLAHTEPSNPHQGSINCKNQ